MKHQNILIKIKEKRSKVVRRKLFIFVRIAPFLIGYFLSPFIRSIWTD